MARTKNESYRDNKANTILKHARRVFCRKGYLAVTMKDIVDECGISRGGIYLYFTSVDQIFQAVVERRDRARFAPLRQAVDNNEPFMDILGAFFALQKERLMCLNDSLLRAMYEYIFSGGTTSSQGFRLSQLGHLRGTVLPMILLGAKQKFVPEEDVDVITDHLIVVVEGLSLLSLAGVLSEKIIDEQFGILSLMFVA